MKLKIKLAALVLINVSMTAVSFAGTDANDFSLTPLSLTQENTPLVMLAMSNDHQLYYKAYPDYTDLDNDGVLDTYYLDSFDYSGYFDSSLCYDYVTSNDGFFRPVRKAVVRANGTTKGSGNAPSALKIKHSCANSEWSGNFLNWASMSRMDVVRHVLYGGNRSTDHTSQAKVVKDSTGTAYKVGYAVLERAYLPNDVHSFGKVVPEWTEVDTDRHTALKHIVPTTFDKNNGLTICSTTDDSTKLPILDNLRLVIASNKTRSSSSKTRRLVSPRRNT